MSSCFTSMVPDMSGLRSDFFSLALNSEKRALKSVIGMCVWLVEELRNDRLKCLVSTYITRCHEVPELVAKVIREPDLKVIFTAFGIDLAEVLFRLRSFG